jgi:hypothetical protein
MFDFIDDFKRPLGSAKTLSTTSLSGFLEIESYTSPQEGCLPAHAGGANIANKLFDKRCKKGRLAMPVNKKERTDDNSDPKINKVLTALVVVLDPEAPPIPPLPAILKTPE